MENWILNNELSQQTHTFSVVKEEKSENFENDYFKKSYKEVFFKRTY